MAPVTPAMDAMFSRWIPFYRRGAEDDAPAIQPAFAAFVSIAYVLVYVLPFYLSAQTRPSPTLTRDAPSVIRARIRAVSFACLVTGTTTTVVGIRYANMSTAQVLRMLGIWPIDPVDILRATALVVLLFLGPLFEAAVAEGRWRAWLSGRAFHATFTDAVGWRNYVAGPVSEELVFRSHILPLHLLSRESTTTLVFLTPLYFGIAHIHHFYEFKLTHPHTPLLPCILRSLFQLTYTTVFGWLAAFLFLRTGSILPPILAHAFCNWMGLPRLWGRLEAAPVTSIGPQHDGSKQPGWKTPGADGRLGLQWTVAYYVLLLAGAVLFFANLWPLTHSANALATFAAQPAVKSAAKSAAKAAAKVASDSARGRHRWNVGGWGTGHANA